MGKIKIFFQEIKNIVRLCGLLTGLKFFYLIITNIIPILKTGNLNQADYYMVGRLYEFKIKPGLKIKLKVTNKDIFGLARTMYGRNSYQAFEGFEIKPTDTVVDLGANVGLFTVLAALQAKEVIAVEAQSGFLPILKANLKQNHVLSKVKIKFGLVGQGSGVLSLFENQKKASHFNEKPPLVSMKEIIKKFNIKKINFLKIDIEGSEFDLFNEKGWLKKVQKISMELHADYGDSKIFIKNLKKHGFKVKLLDKNQKIIPFGLINKITDSGLYLFAYR